MIAEILHPEKILSDALQRRPAVSGGCNRRLSHQVTVRVLAPLLGDIGAQVVVNEPKSVKPLSLFSERFGEDNSCLLQGVSMVPLGRALRAHACVARIRAHRALRGGFARASRGCARH